MAKTYKISYWLILYILVSISLGATAINFLYQRGQAIGAAILLVLLILIFIFYGLRWFPASSLPGSGPPPIQWPPIVNMCPDFMVTWTDPMSKKIYCYDANNLYDLQNASGLGLTQNLNINNVAGKSAYLIHDPSQNKSAQNITADTGGLRWPLANTLVKSPATVTANNKMRWEGVWNGANVSVANIPLP